LAPTSKAQHDAVTRYKQKNYDRLELRTQKGQREEIKAHAERIGESMNAFLLRAIKETMQRDIEASDKQVKEKTT